MRAVHCVTTIRRYRASQAAPLVASSPVAADDKLVDRLVVTHSFYVSSYAQPYGSLADPPASSVLLAAMSWLQGTLLGSVATLIATIGIASVGFMMLTGRLSVRPGIAAIAGSFILFGASVIVAGIQASLQSETPVAVSYAPPPAPVVAPTAVAPLAAPLADNDPYAGASVPMQ